MDVRGEMKMLLAIHILAGTIALLCAALAFSKPLRGPFENPFGSLVRGTYFSPIRQKIGPRGAFGHAESDSEA